MCSAASELPWSSKPMIKRWILYLVCLIGCLIFYVAYQGWVAWVLLCIVALTPLLSLLLSLAPMLLVRPTMDFPSAVTVMDEEALAISIRSILPIPPCRFRFRIRHTLTGEEFKMRADDDLPTGHCGALLCHSSSFHVYDYMGMFRLRLKRLPDREILIRPQTIAMNPPKELDRFLARSWKPKYGGGFAEQHEMRLYRPGDSLNQVHWKLTAKTGKLIVREPMVPRPGRVLLTMDLAGTPAEMDRKLGKLQWMSNHLLELGIAHEIHALTGSGLRTLPIQTEPDLQNALDSLLLESPAITGTVLSSNVIASWRYHIGGDDDDT